ncbi:hypothetical protein EYF80_007198 [Liparis tanakae]|uniref:Uncharacterized protein n=1 Tax=Liparis tanakae TaxID=230148 RepID=A0A4Z2IXI2_9TELE|nr:hypothetical protein EYF80_007198 [Liparis tanakae]
MPSGNDEEMMCGARRYVTKTEQLFILYRGRGRECIRLLNFFYANEQSVDLAGGGEHMEVELMAVCMLGKLEASAGEEDPDTTGSAYRTHLKAADMGPLRFQSQPHSLLSQNI